MEITIQVKVNASLKRVWSAWTTPEDIVKWNFASEDWCCPEASIQLEPGGRFSYRMEAKDKSFGFDFSGEFARVDHLKKIEMRLGDQRTVSVSFIETSEGTLVQETFQAESQNSVELQRQGWQAILNNFKAHVESSQ
jgi:uncharacterized protein YndB with AHSA1/START domain